MPLLKDIHDRSLMALRSTTLLAVIQRLQSQEPRPIAQLRFNPQQRVVLGDAIGPRGGAGLDLACARGYGEVCDERVFGFAGAMRDDRRVAVAARQVDGVERLADGADLVDFDQNRVGYAFVDSLLQKLDI